MAFKPYSLEIDVKNSKTIKTDIAPKLNDTVELTVTLKMDNEVMDVTNSKISLMIAKSNGIAAHQIDKIEILDGLNGIFRINLRTSCVDVVGSCYGNFIIESEIGIITTATFVYRVGSVVSGEKIETAKDDLQVLSQLHEIIELYKEEIETARKDLDNLDVVSITLQDRIEVLVDKVETLETVEVDDYADVNNTKRTWSAKKNNDTFAKASHYHDDYSSKIHTHDLATDTSNGLLKASDYVKLQNVENEANKYTHPSKHDASMISESTTKRFVTDAEKTVWNDRYSKQQTDNLLSKYVLTQSGKGLSTNDFTTAYKNKLSNLPDYVYSKAEVDSLLKEIMDLINK